MRIDHTATETVPYEILENTEICGVPLLKGTLLSINLFGPHYNPKEWTDPTEFIPERFDPKSKYYLSPSTGKARNPLSYIPFSVGKRVCPGQTLARIAQKVNLAYLVKTLDYSVNQSQLEQERILFNNYSQFHLMLTINNRNL